MSVSKRKWRGPNICLYLERMVSLKNVDLLMCLGFVLLIQTRWVLLVIIFSHITRAWERVLKGGPSLQPSTLVSTQVPSSRTEFTNGPRKSRAKLKMVFKFIPFLTPKQAENLTTWLWRCLLPKPSRCGRHIPFAPQLPSPPSSIWTCIWGLYLTPETEGYDSQ